jgi:hypothetical protein
MDNRVIVLEFNELTPALVDRFIAQGHLPNFARLRAESIVAVTDAEETFPTLEPWIQWVTVHTCLTQSTRSTISATARASPSRGSGIWRRKRGAPSGSAAA